VPFNPPLTTDETGSVAFALRTSGLAPGSYTVTIMVGDNQVSLAQAISVSTSFTLDESAPLRSDEGSSAPLQDVPATVQPAQSEAAEQSLYLPLVVR
jgi:hypothetical protein